MPVLVVLSMFTILLAVIAGVRRLGLPEGERFVVVVDGGMGRGGDGSDGGRSGSRGEGEGRGGGRCECGWCGGRAMAWRVGQVFSTM